MLNRIAVIGKSPALEQSARKALKDHGEALIAVPDVKSLPPSATSVIGLAKDGAQILEAAMMLAARQDALLLLLAQAVDAREGIPAGNAAHVREVADHFAMAVSLSPEDKVTLLRGALLHDIGKLQVSNEVLLTKSMLTHDEWDQLRQHTTLGAELVAAQEGLRDVEAIVRWHHECYDGTGYPDGLEGEAIPYLARMMKIIDVFCSMTGPRHYRTTVSSPEEAIAHIQSEAGKHFDPELARVFVEAVSPAEEYRG